ncbi:hypothetical protein DPMN_162306 [Dreissena polymorpha]|uniref:Uncharacterized protein n=1 Tax=Dreissena polymorpha TaxID=45954 RepID=A0A9D4EUU6_DREPO|nr:hypothetical protein DPMN_162306 [Dreissena polymorpha]
MRGLLLTSSSPVSDVHIIKICISIETRIAKRWFVFEAFEPATVIIRVSDMPMNELQTPIDKRKLANQKRSLLQQLLTY